MVWEYLADFRNKNSPRDTTKIAHTVRTNTSIFSPNLNYSQCLFEVFSLFARKLDDHQVILSTNKWSSALLIFNGV